MASEARQTAYDIFHLACELAPQERAAYLDKACAGNDELRHEIEDLLKHYEDQDTFLEKPALHDAARQLANEITMPESQTEPQISSLHDGDRRIGPYRIISQLGRGGMGVVYLAEDTENDRQVAIKVLPRDFLRDEDRLARFNREARMLEELRHLKHPNIAEIYEQTEHDGKPCLVLEYVPGETLEDRLNNGRLTVAESLQIARQIADALATAHQQHIVHRDLKPANIKITPEGMVKVLDFGLAKRFYPDFTDEEADEFHTRSLSLTESGMLIGTPAYMSPEQWDGKEIDQRSDLWAFGCLLFEMLTGLQPFARKTRAETMKSVFEASPDWQALPQRTPIIIQDLLRNCLQKDLGVRLQDAEKARRAITSSLNSHGFGLSLLLKSWKWK
ncbi:MAG: serine/threonine protein kinase, partial [Acidobacteria bacterium]|nr:serine/threonine protein kinase [Acidobacteriota bacterium]